MNMLNVSYRKVGGLRFIKIGRLTLMWCVSRQYKPLLPAVTSAANSVE